MILALAAEARKAERVSPRSAAASSIASSRPASSERLARAERPRSRMKWDQCKNGTFVYLFSDAGIVFELIHCAGRRQGLVLGQRVFGPKPHRFDRVPARLIVAACRGAVRQIGNETPTMGGVPSINAR